MKLLHLGDLHIGKYLGEFDLIKDQEYILNQILGIVERESVNAVMIAGDVYDKSIPSEAATSLLDDFLCGLVKLNVEVYMISGNHDSDDRLNFGSRLFQSNNLYISSIYNGELFKKTVDDDYGEVDVYLLPFVKASQVKHFFPDDSITTYDDAVKSVIRHANIDSSRRNVIVAHQFVTGNGNDPELGGSEGLAVQTVGTVEKIGYDCFDAFDYAALGHIHSAQQVGRAEVRYSGSPLKYSLSEVNNIKSVPIVTIGAKGDTDMRLVPLKPLRDVRHIKGEINSIIDKSNITSPDDYIFVTLTDEDYVSDAMGILQKYYPHTVKFIYENSHTSDGEIVDISKIADNKPFDELISDFYQMMYSCDISDEEMEIMKEVAREVGVIDEAD